MRFPSQGRRASVDEEDEAFVVDLSTHLLRELLGARRLVKEQARDRRTSKQAVALMCVNAVLNTLGPDPPSDTAIRRVLNKVYDGASARSPTLGIVDKVVDKVVLTAVTSLEEEMRQVASHLCKARRDLADAKDAATAAQASASAELEVARLATKLEVDEGCRLRDENAALRKVEAQRFVREHAARAEAYPPEDYYAHAQPPEDYYDAPRPYAAPYAACDPRLSARPPDLTGVEAGTFQAVARAVRASVDELAALHAEQHRARRAIDDAALELDECRIAAEISRTLHETLRRECDAFGRATALARDGERAARDGERLAAESRDALLADADRGARKARGEVQQLDKERRRIVSDQQTHLRAIEADVSDLRTQRRALTDEITDLRAQRRSLAADVADAAEFLRQVPILRPE